LTEVMCRLPSDWPVEDEELEALVEFLLGRRSGVAGRLRDMATSLEKG
jgi:uncharacterized protein YdhG (YjbR/CyaY superfamily)